MAERLITKIKSSKGRIFIAYSDKSGTNEDEFTLNCLDEPLDSFRKAMADLKPHVQEWLEIEQPEWCEDLVIKGVSFSWTDGIMGAVITCEKPLTYAQSPLNLNTPHKPQHPYSDGDDEALEYCLKDECVFALEKLIEEAKKYINGERAQGQLFGGDDELEGDIDLSEQEMQEVRLKQWT
jgi:hypothetical protein